MKYRFKVFTYFLFLALICSGCITTTSQYTKEMKELIPDLKLLLTENIDLFNEVETILHKPRDFSFYVKRGTSDDLILFVSNDFSRHFQESDVSFQETTLLSIEERVQIENLFALSESKVKIDQISREPYIVAWANLVDLRLMYSIDDDEISTWTERAYYIEEMSENWYAFIIVSKPI